MCMDRSAFVYMDGLTGMASNLAIWIYQPIQYVVFMENPQESMVFPIRFTKMGAQGAP